MYPVVAPEVPPSYPLSCYYLHRLGEPSSSRPSLIFFVVLSRTSPLLSLFVPRSLLTFRCHSFYPFSPLSQTTHTLSLCGQYSGIYVLFCAFARVSVFTISSMPSRQSGRVAQNTGNKKNCSSVVCCGETYLLYSTQVKKQRQTDYTRLLLLWVHHEAFISEA